MSIDISNRTKGEWMAKDIFQGSTDEIIADNKRIALVIEYDNFGNKINDFEERKANAAFICLAVNNYEKLVDALQRFCELRTAYSKDDFNTEYHNAKELLNSIEQQTKQ